MLFLGLVSSDQSLCRAISEQLKEAGSWQLAVFSSLEEALSVWSDMLPPLILWDAEDSPATEELAQFFAARLEEAHPSPLLVLIGEAPKALDAFGVTEGLQRPLRLGYLLARLQFYQRLLQQSPDVVLALGPWRFAPRARTLSPLEGGGAMKLTDKEANLLEYLYATEEPVSRDELLAAIWGYDARMDTHTLETHIYRLRRKLAPAEGTAGDVFLTDSRGYLINPSWRAR